MDLMGNAEQLGNDAAVRWLAEQEWSNGAVGMIGKSYYDGSYSAASCNVWSQTRLSENHRAHFRIN